MSLLTELVSPKLILGPKPESAEGPACPKCRWTGKDPEVGWRKYLWVSADPAGRMNFNLVDEKLKPLGECLMVSCERCCFRWREDVAAPDVVEEPS